MTDLIDASTVLVFSRYGTRLNDQILQFVQFNSMLHKYSLISLNAKPESESNMLSALRSHAKAAAPHFSNEILANFLISPICINLSMDDEEQLDAEFQHWFINLFSLREPGSQDIRDIRIESRQFQYHPPVSFLLSNLEMILKYGREVTSLRPQSELSYRAFVKALAYELAKKQVGMEQRLEYSSELLLLD